MYIAGGFGAYLEKNRIKYWNRNPKKEYACTNTSNQKNAPEPYLTLNDAGFLVSGFGSDR